MVRRRICEHMFVRWSNLTIDEEEQRRLPGYRDEAVVRRFDAPEALDTRFYEVRAKSVLNRVPGKSRMPFRWTINPYRGCTHACVYCFARPTHKYLDFDAGRDFEREIVVKVNAPEVLARELARPSWKREHVALGTNTDPYQWVEGRYRLMVGIWEALRDAANPCSVLTKSPLLLRDLAADARDRGAHERSRACLSIPTLDEKAWRATEPHTPNPRARLEAVAELNRAGIPTGVLIAPLMPGINDAPASGRAAAGGGARGGRDERRRGRAAPARRGAQGLHGLAARPSGPTWSRATRSSTAAAPTRRQRNASACRAWSRRGGRPARVSATRSGASRRRRPLERRQLRARTLQRRRRCSERASPTQRLSRCACVHLRGDLLRAQPPARLWRRARARGPRTARPRAARAAPRRPRRGCRSIASHDRVARRPRASACRCRRGSLTPASANMPASRMKPGKMAETPTPLACRSARSAAAKPRRPNLVAL